MIAVWSFLVACWILQTPPAAKLSAPSVRVVHLPAAGLQPRAAIGPSGRVHLVYFAGDPQAGDLFYVHSDDGEHFSAPLRVNTHEHSAVATGSIRGAQIALGKGERVHVAWVGSDRAEPKASLGATPMLYTRLDDRRAAFEPERNLITRCAGLDGGGAVAANDSGDVWVVWHAPDSDRREVAGGAARRVCIATSHDEGKSFAAEVTPSALAQLGACECCELDALAPLDRTLRVLYRTARDGRDRDLWSIDYDDGALDATPISTWRSEQCVMSSASLALRRTADGDLVYGAWEVEGRVELGCLWSTSDETWRSAPLGRATSRKHPRIAVERASGRILLAWSENAGWQRGGTLAWQVFDSDGRPIEGAHGEGDAIPTWSFAAPIALRDGRFFLYE